MSLFDRLLGRAVASRDVRRVVVVDTETRGLDPDRDPLVSIGGVAVDDQGIVPGDSFEVIVADAPRGAGAADIVIHGIGAQAQAGGMSAREALSAWHAWAGDAPRIGFHAGFDRKVLRRAAAAVGAEADRATWLDLAALAPVVAPSRVSPRGGGLDDWLEALGLGCGERHNAAGDALATAELYLWLRAAAAARGKPGFAGLASLAREARWLEGS
jgi:DNA polymerase-3 subunit epsilon